MGEPIFSEEIKKEFEKFKRELEIHKRHLQQIDRVITDCLCSECSQKLTCEKKPGG